MENDVVDGAPRGTKNLAVGRGFLNRANNIFNINEDHSYLMSLHFYSQYMDGINTDFVISANGEDHKCHSFIVDFNSEKIKTVSNEVKRFNIDNVSTFGVKEVLEFFYRGNIKGIDSLQHDKGKQILYVAKELQVFQIYMEFRKKRSDIFRTFARENGIEFEFSKSIYSKSLSTKSNEEKSASNLTAEIDLTYLNVNKVHETTTSISVRTPNEQLNNGTKPKVNAVKADLGLNNSVTKSNSTLSSLEFVPSTKAKSISAFLPSQNISNSQNNNFQVNASVAGIPISSPVKLNKFMVNLNQNHGKIFPVAISSPSSVTAMQQTCVVSGMNKNVNNNTLQVTIKNPSPTTTSNSVISNNQQPSLQKLLSTHINNHEMLPEQNTPQQLKTEKEKGTKRKSSEMEEKFIEEFKKLETQGLNEQGLVMCPFCNKQYKIVHALVKHMGLDHFHIEKPMEVWKKRVKKKRIKKPRKVNATTYRKSSPMKSDALVDSSFGTKKRDSFTVKKEPNGNYFPCKLCGRIFTGLRNMNGHLSHCPVKKMMNESSKQQQPSSIIPVQYPTTGEGENVVVTNNKNGSTNIENLSIEAAKQRINTTSLSIPPAFPGNPVVTSAVMATTLAGEKTAVGTAENGASKQ